MQPNNGRFFDHGDRSGLRTPVTDLEKRGVQGREVEARLLGGSHRSGVPDVVASGFVRFGVRRLHLAVVARLAVVRKTCVGVPGHQREHPSR